MERRPMFMPFTVLEGFENCRAQVGAAERALCAGIYPRKYLVIKRTLTQAEAEDGIKQLQYAKRQGYSYRRHRCHLQ